MQQQGLLHEADLVSQRRPCEGNGIPTLTLKQIADRLFFSGRPIPEQIFTGYDFDYYIRYEDGMDFFRNWLEKQGVCSNDRYNPYYISELKKALDSPDTVIEQARYSRRDQKPLFDFLPEQAENRPSTRYSDDEWKIFP